MPEMPAPENRPPKADEMKICRENWLDKQISLINPKVIVLLGAIAVKQVLGKEEKLTLIYGQIFEQDERTVFITYHPASAMRFAKTGQLMKSDFNKIRGILKTIEPGPPPRVPGSKL